MAIILRTMRFRELPKLFLLLHLLPTFIISFLKSVGLSKNCCFFSNDYFMEFNDASIEEINEVMQKAWDAFTIFRKASLKERAGFMRAIAKELENAGDELIQTAMQETHLPEARLKNEKARTVFQLNSYADACEKGDWLEARIDTAVA